MSRRLAWSLAALGLFLSAHGSFLNDEDDQAAAFWSLGHGSLRVEEYPFEFYQQSENIHVAPRYSGTDLPVGSTALNVLALPVAGVLFVVDAIMPIGLALASGFTLCAWNMLGLRWPWQSEGRLSASLRAGALVGLLALASGGFRPESPTLDVFYPYLALKLTNLALWGAGLALLWRVLEVHVPDRTVRVAALLAAAFGSWLFWGATLKYHSLTAFLAALALWLFTRPRTTGNVLARGVAAGLAVWVNLAGIALALAIGLAELVLVVRARKLGHGAKTLGVALVGVLVGIAPALVEGAVLGNPLGFLRSGPVETAEPGAEGDASTGSFFSRALAVMLHYSHLGQPKELAIDLFVVLTTGHTVEGQPLGILMLNPLLIAAVPGIAIAIRHRLGGAPLLSVLLLGTMALFVTEPATHQGGGWDVRMWLPAIPALALLAAIGLGAVWKPGSKDARRVLATTAIVALALLAVLVSVVAAGYEFGRTNYEHVHRFLFAAWIALALAAAFVLVWAAVRGRARTAAATIVGFALAFPLVWGAIFMLGEPYEIYAKPPNEGGTMLVTGVDPIAAWFEGHIVHHPPLPFVYNENGDLVFHPDYGLCTREPSPCPDEVRSQFQRPPYEDV